MQKVYTITLQNFCRRSCSYCPSLGFLGESIRSVEEFSAVLADIPYKKNSSIRIPCASIDTLPLQPYLEAILSTGMRAELLFHADTDIDTGGGISKISALWSDLSPDCRSNMDITVLLPMEIRKDKVGFFYKDEIDFFYQIDNICGAIKYLLIPSQESELVERIKSLPRFLEGRLELGFPLKRNANDGLLSPDEIYLTLLEVQKVFYSFEPKTYAYLNDFLSPSEKDRYAKQLIFLETLDPRFFIENLEFMGKFAGLRRLFSSWTKNRWLWPLRPFLLLILAPIWLIIDPKQASVATYWLARRFGDLCHRLGINSFWFMWKQSSKTYEAGQSLFWRVWRIGSNYYERYLGYFWGTIWQKIYPVRKILYFTSYQIRTRILKKPTD